MGQPYDCFAAYDWFGTYDGGAEVPIPAPANIAMLRVVDRQGAANESLFRAPWSAPVSVQSEIGIGGPDISSSYDAALGYDSGVLYDSSGPRTQQSEIRARWISPSPVLSIVRLALDAALALESDIRARWSAVIAHDEITRIALDAAQARLASLTRARWMEPVALQTFERLAWRAGRAQMVEARTPWGAPVARNVFVRLRWAPGAPFNSGYTIPFSGDPDLPPGSTIVIPPLSVYFMIPNLSIIRTSDSTDLNAIDCSIHYDVSSYSWTFQANCPRASLAFVDPNTRSDPELVQINNNGYLFNMIVESYVDARKFGGTGVQIAGRSRSALLGAPYAPRATFTEASSKDASQLATDALAGTGWTLVWGAVDWLVPGGTFTYADKTPIEAVAQIVNAIGAVLFCDPETLTLTVQPMYATSPWAWSGATPFASIPNAFWTDLSGQWEGQGTPAFDGVYVSGQNGGVVGLVKLTGTAGANQLPPVNDALIVHTDARRERGRIELAKGLKRKTETIKMPVLLAPASGTNPGIIPPGALIEVAEQDAVDGTPGPTWLGQVMSVQVDSQKGKVRQTLAVERHE